MKSKKVKNVQHYIEYLLFRLICFILNLFPLSTVLYLGKWFGRLLYQVLPQYRKVAIDNLRFAFGHQKSEPEIERMALECFENLGKLGGEILYMPTVIKNIKKFVVFKNQEILYNALKKGTGVVLVVTHYGNWEWMSLAAGLRAGEVGIKITGVGRALGNPYLQHYLVEELRGATGFKTVHKKGAALKTVSTVEKGETVCILIDQHERHGSVPVPFFGRDAWTTSLPAMLALKKDAIVISVFPFRQKNGPTIVEFGEPFETIRTGNYEEDLVANTAQYIKALEDVAKKRPTDWLWMHARWRAHRTEKVR